MTRAPSRTLRQSAPARPGAPVRTPVGTLVGTLGCALVVGVAAGCTPGDAEPFEPVPSTVTASTPASVAPSDGLAVEVRQGRASWADRVVQVRVVNHRDEPVQVRTAALTTSTTATAATSDPARGRDVPPGRSRDFSVALGPAACAPGAVTAGPAVTASAVLELVTPDGPARTEPVPVTDPQGHLPRILAEDCAAEALASALEVRVDGLSTQQGPDGLVGVLAVTFAPVAGGPPAAVTAIDGTILMAPVDGRAWAPPELATPVTAPTTVRLAFRANRCDPHAVAEDKRGTFLGVHATVDGVPQHVVFVGTGEGLTGQVHDYVAAACGW